MSTVFFERIAAKGGFCGLKHDIAMLGQRVINKIDRLAVALGIIAAAAISTATAITKLFRT